MIILSFSYRLQAFLVAQLVKNLPAMWETWVQSLGWEDLLEKEKGYPLQYSGLENSRDCIVHGVTKRRTRLSDLRFHFSISGTPLVLTRGDFEAPNTRGKKEMTDGWACLTFVNEEEGAHLRQFVPDNFKFPNET